MDERPREIETGLGLDSAEAWSRLYDAYAQRLWREVARLLGGNGADVADVVQETFLAAARSADQYNPRRGSPWAWLIGIGRRQAALRQRKDVSRQRTARKFWQELNGRGDSWLSGKADAPPDVLESEELASLVRSVLVDLPQHYQSLLTWKYLDGVSTEQIARQTESTGEAVRAKLVRARKAFRKAFARTVSKDVARLWSAGDEQ